MNTIVDSDVEGNPGAHGCHGSFADPTEPRFVPDLGADAPEDGLMSDTQFHDQAMRQIGEAKFQLSHRARLVLGTDEFVLTPSMHVTTTGVQCHVLLVTAEAMADATGRHWGEAMDAVLDKLKRNPLKVKQAASAA